MPTSVPTAASLTNAAKALPRSFPTDVVHFLENVYFGNADLLLVSNFLEAAKTLAAAPNFKAMKNKQQAELHCVRCHDTFTAETNGPTKCVIPHVFDTEPTFTGEVSGYEKVYGYKAICCGSVELEEEGAGNDEYRNLKRIGHCYKGYHTTDAEEVEDEQEYNDVNIRRCKLDKETKECMVLCIDGENPVFDWQVPNTSDYDDDDDESIYL
ncbi:hypothetical protein BDZ94DRAFT_1323080 [Collybia nuda]|uniref:Uncharacterized protein n=1 Tax=Collybia nuda TaxID=64659 RepID=A0A9P6CII4_9AGAR|nr:hypothetical protein BDZ94DRAFT_1323080 [Collybia nuda]